MSFARAHNPSTLPIPSGNTAVRTASPTPGTAPTPHQEERQRDWKVRAIQGSPHIVMAASWRKSGHASPAIVTPANTITSGRVSQRHSNSEYDRKSTLGDVAQHEREQ